MHRAADLAPPRVVVYDEIYPYRDIIAFDIGASSAAPKENDTEEERPTVKSRHGSGHRRRD